MGKRSVQYYVPSKNRRKRKHYWWRYLLVFILGQTLVLPGNLLLIGTAGTAATSMKLSTILQLAQQDPSKYLTEETMDSNIFQLIGQLTAKDADGNSAFDSINGLDKYIKVKDLLSELANSINQPAISALLTDDLYNTKFSEMGDYFTTKLEIAPILDSLDLPLPSLVTDLLYNTPVAYFGQNVSSIKAVKGDVIDLSINDFTVLPASASNKAFEVTATDPSMFSCEGSSVTINQDDAITAGQSYEFTATPADTTNDTVLPITFNIEIVDSLQCEKVTPYYDRDNQIIIWNNVDFASKYKVEYPAGWNKESTEAIDNFISLDGLDLTDGTVYELKITTIGQDEKHTNSDVLTFQFKFTASPVTPDPEPQGGDGDGGKGDGKSIKREGEPEPETTIVDTNGSYIDAMGEAQEFNHPNGYDDSTGKLIRKGLTISELGNAFGDILGIFADKTIGDLMSMLGGESSGSDNTSEPKVPVINKIAEPTDIMSLFSSLKITSLMGGDGIMGALGSASLGLLIPENTSNPDDIMNSLRSYTFGQFMNGEVDIMDAALKGKTFRGLGFIKDNEGLLGMIADCCLISPDDYPEDYYENHDGYEGPINVLDMFNHLTIGEALGNPDGDSGNAILDALTDIPLQCDDVGGEMAIRMGGGHSDVTNKDYEGTTVGELLNMTKSDNALLNSLINCKLSSDALTSCMDDLKLVDVIGEDEMFASFHSDYVTINSSDEFDAAEKEYGKLYSDFEATKLVEDFASAGTYYYRSKYVATTVTYDGDFDVTLKNCGILYKDPELTEKASYSDISGLGSTLYHGPRQNLKGIWALMFDSVADAEGAKLTEMGTLLGSVGTNMLETSLNELKRLELLKMENGLDGTLTISITMKYAELDSSLAATKGDETFTIHYSLDKEGYVEIYTIYDQSSFDSAKTNHKKLYYKDGDEYKEAESFTESTQYYREKTLGEYSLKEIIDVLAKLGSN